VERKVNLGIELEREVSPAIYLWDRKSEFPAFAECDAVKAAIETGVALEQLEFGRARRSWRRVVRAAREAGRAARSQGLTPRRLIAEIDRVRQAMEDVLFDGRLPPDLAASGARCMAKMCARVLDHALRTYWQEGLTTGPA
jgi:hypothetical protein